MKKLHILTVLAFVLLFFFGCNDSSQPGKKKILTYTEVQGDRTSEVIEAMKGTSSLPNVDIRPQPVPSNLLNYEPFVLSLSTGSNAIDAYLLDAPWVKRYSSTRWLAPIDEDKHDFKLESYRKELLDVTSFISQGKRKVLAIPFETKGNILFLRRDLLKKYNLKAPDTWDELFAQCLYIQEKEGEAGPEFGFLFHGKVLINDFYPIMWSFGGGVLNDDGDLTINTPENIRALAMVKRMLGTISPSAEEMEKLGLFEDYGAVDRIFAQGDAIFMINWNNRWRDLENGIEGQKIGIDQICVAPLPRDSENPHYSNIGSFCWGINLSSKNPEEAQKLIHLITSFESQKWRAINHGVIPSRLDVLEDIEVGDKAPAVIRLAGVFEKVQLRSRPFQKEINSELDAILISTLYENRNPEQALNRAQEQITEKLSWTIKSGRGSSK